MLKYVVFTFQGNQFSFQGVINDKNEYFDDFDMEKDNGRPSLYMDSKYCIYKKFFGFLTLKQLRQGKKITDQDNAKMEYVGYIDKYGFIRDARKEYYKNVIAYFRRKEDIVVLYSTKSEPLAFILPYQKSKDESKSSTEVYKEYVEKLESIF